MPETYTVSQVAKILGYSTNSIYTFLKEKRIRGVKIGKGRVRIPAEELARVLGTKKAPLAPAIAPPPPSAVVTQALTTLAPVQEEKPPLLLSSLRSLFEGELPNLFDWYIGIVSILLGCSMFLFNRYLSSEQIAPYLLWLLPIRISFMVTGASVLFIGFFQTPRSVQYRSVHVLLSITYLLFSLILWQIGEWDGAALYSLTSVSIFLMVLLQTGGIISFFLYALLLLAVLPIILAASPIMTPFGHLLTFMPWSPTISNTLWLIIVGFIALCTLGSYRHNRFLFRLSLAAMVLGHLLLSLWYGTQLAWGQALLLSLLSAMILIVPQWSSLPFEQRWTKIIISGTFARAFVVLFLGLVSIQLMQQHMVEHAQSELTNTATYSRMALTTTFDTIRVSLENEAHNTLVIQALKKQDTEELSKIARTVYEANHGLLRLGYVTTAGNPITLYPPLNQEPTVDYELNIRPALTTHKTSVSPLTELSSLNDTPMILVTAPIEDSNHLTVGAAIALVDLYSLTDTLQQSVSPKEETSIIVTDTNGKLIIHPNVNLIGTIAQAADSAVEPTLSTSQGYTETGVHVLQAKTRLPTLPMNLSVIQPMETVLPVKVMVYFLLVCTGIMYAIMMGANFYFLERKGASQQE